jgi:hypothetical protein
MFSSIARKKTKDPERSQIPGLLFFGYHFNFTGTGIEFENCRLLPSG